MIIKSQFKDYYDHISHVYGGGDPNVIYIRKRFTDSVQLNTDIKFPPKVVPFKPEIKHAPNQAYDKHSHWCGYETKWLIVCARYYLILKPINSTIGWKVFTEKNFPEIWGNVKARRYNNYFTFLQQPTGPEWYCGSEGPELVELSRLVGAPVFTICNNWRYNEKQYDVDIDSEIPILQDIGMQSIITPQQMYQDIAYFVGNTIKESPDMMPPTKMTDIEKIEQHGFDKKKSFRHRK